MLGIKKFLIFGSLFVFLLALFLSFSFLTPREDTHKVLSDTSSNSHWFILHRKSNTEELYFGVPGKKDESRIVRRFQVKTGQLGKSPTPLPRLLGKEYWLIINKEDSSQNPETAPYFLTLNIDAPDDWPYGPIPYEECDQGQCDWGRSGYFGLHGVAGDLTRLSPEAVGSSGCIRHTDEDIAYLYNLLDPFREEIRYYVEDN